MENSLMGSTVQIAIAEPWDYPQGIGVVLFGIVTGIKTMHGRSCLNIQLKARIHWHARNIDELWASGALAGDVVAELASGRVVPMRFGESIEVLESVETDRRQLTFVGAMHSLGSSEPKRGVNCEAISDSRLTEIRSKQRFAQEWPALARPHWKRS